VTWNINLNADLGEAPGPSAELIALVPSVTIACGDPRSMHRLSAQAVEAGIDVGALIRPPRTSGDGPDDLRDDVLYQVGALDAFVQSEGGAMRHVKPHGSLSALCGQREEYARALLEAVAKYDDEMIVVAGPGWPQRLADSYGLTVVREGYLDREYRPDGRIEQVQDPDEVVRRALRLAKDRTAGSTFDVMTLTLSGDTPNVVEVTRRVRQRLAEEDVGIVGLTPAVAAV
jgi:UPF0271 protein